jgi:hypothetical protein
MQAVNDFVDSLLFFCADPGADLSLSGHVPQSMAAQSRGHGTHQFRAEQPSLLRAA